MKTLSNCSPTWRRPRLALVVFGLTICYAELAIESELLAEYGLIFNKSAAERSVSGDVDGDAVNLLVGHPIVR
jgi:hypothetical protein